MSDCPIADLDRYRVTPGSSKVDLDDWKPDDDQGRGKDHWREAYDGVVERLDELQRRLWAEGKQSLLVILQAMDTAGKDNTIRRVFGPLNPQGVRVWNFRKPSERELAHDYLWRVHSRTPRDGMITVFNRSHYEDVLVVRVHDLVPKERWSRRYDHINAFEQLLVDEGTRILKIYLHITPEYQRKRLQRRLDRPDKHWKFNPSDLSERKLWRDYRTAYETAFSRCSTEAAPWYVVPAEARWFRTVLVASLVARELERMVPAYPEPDFDPSTITIEPLP